MLEHAIVRTPGRNFSEGLTTIKGAAPDYEKTLEQHEAYCAALERCGLAVERLPADVAYPDSTFVEDAAIVTRHFAILTHPGAKSRMGEVEGIREPVRRFFRVIREVTAAGTLDGGDVCEADGHFFIGISRRTNEEGAKQLASFLAESGCTSSAIDIRRKESILHLKSGVSYLGDGQLVVAEELAGHEEFRRFESIQVAPEESYAANCVRVNNYVMIPEGYPKVAAALVRRGFRVLPLDVSEFRKMDGGLSCLSLRF